MRPHCGHATVEVGSGLLSLHAGLTLLVQVVLQSGSTMCGSCHYMAHMPHAHCHSSLVHSLGTLTRCPNSQAVQCGHATIHGHTTWPHHMATPGHTTWPHHMAVPADEFFPATRSITARPVSGGNSRQCQGRFRGSQLHINNGGPGCKQRRGTLSYSLLLLSQTAEA